MFACVAQTSRNVIKVYDFRIPIISQGKFTQHPCDHQNFGDRISPAGGWSTFLNPGEKFPRGCVNFKLRVGILVVSGEEPRRFLIVFGPAL